MSEPAAPGRDAGRILVVEDDPDQLRVVASILRREGHAVVEARSVDEADAVLRGGGVDLVLSDRRLGDRDGLELLRALRSRGDATPFVLVTAYGSVGHAVAALREGAGDYLVKPFERDALLLAVGRALESRRLREENRRLAEELGARDRLAGLTGFSPSMQRVYRILEKVAGTDATVLLRGESGTGKELAARALHALSRRAGGPFVAVNCGAIPEGLLEAELFGAARGAYTGADRSRPGRFELAAGGTLFLDEIGELPPAMQPKLLRVLQEGRVTPLGASEEIALDVRVVAASNRDLAAAVAAGTFREDLYYRLDVVSIEMPPLRERRDDIPALVDHFLREASRRHGRTVEPLPPAMLRRLVDHPWPGNVRELRNVVERLVLLSDDGRVQEDAMPPGLGGPSPADGGYQLPPQGLSWDAHERSLLTQALALAGGNRARAARLLDLPYRAFLYRLAKHGLAPDGE